MFWIELQKPLFNNTLVVLNIGTALGWILCNKWWYSLVSGKEKIALGTHYVGIVCFDATTSNPTCILFINHYNIFGIFNISVSQFGIGPWYMVLCLF